MVHSDAAGLAALLPTTELVRDLEVPLVTPLVTLGDAPGDVGHLDHTEFWPWVNAYCRPIPGAGAREGPEPAGRGAAQGLQPGGEG